MPLRSRLAVVGEALLILAIVSAPWYFGCAPDSGRYLLCAALLASAALFAGGGVRVSEIAAAFALPAVGICQIVLGATVSRVWTAEALLVLVAMLATMLAVRAYSSQPLVAQRLSGAILLAGLVQAGFGAVSWSLAPAQIYGRTRADITLPFGSFVDHNHFAGFVEMAALLAAGLALGHARRARQISPASVALGGVALALGAAQFASQSRGGLLALGGGAVVLAWLAVAFLFRDKTNETRSRLGIAAAVTLAGLAFAWLAVAPAARARLFSVLSARADASGSYREAIARATLRLAAAHPLLGSGLGAFEDAVPPFKTSHGEVRATHAESDLLELAAEAGLLGFLAVAWLAASVLRAFVARLAPGRDPFRKGMTIGAMSGVAALLIHSLFDFNFRLPSNALVFAVLVGLASSPPLDEAAPSGPAIRGPFAAFLALLAIACVWRAAAAVRFDAAVGASEANSRIEALDAVIRWHPYLAEARRARGVAWRELGTAPSPFRSQRLARAEQDLSAALESRPQWAEALADRGWVRAMRGDPKDAEADFARALLLDPTHPGIAAVASEFHKRSGVQR